MVVVRKNPNGAGQDPIKVKAQKRRYYLKHREYIIQKAKEWAENNPDKRKQIVARNNAKSVGRKREWHEIKYFGITLKREECELCGFSEETKLVIHHRDGNNGRLGKSLNNSIDNLQVLCRKCHPRVHYRGEIRVLTK